MVVRQLDGRRQSPRTHDSTPSSLSQPCPNLRHYFLFRLGPLRALWRGLAEQYT
jgi:hypothetical protein